MGVTFHKAYRHFVSAYLHFKFVSVWVTHPASHWFSTICKYSWRFSFESSTFWNSVRWLTNLYQLLNKAKLTVWLSRRQSATVCLAILIGGLSPRFSSFITKSANLTLLPKNSCEWFWYWDMRSYGAGIAVKHYQQCMHRSSLKFAKFASDCLCGCNLNSLWSHMNC